MARRFRTLPLFVLLIGVAALAMIVPALHAWTRSDFATGRIFLYGAILFGILTVLIGLATANRPVRNLPRSQLFTLLGAFAGLPVIMAVPFYEAVPRTSFLEAWFEMVSSFTTTGATLYDSAGRLNPTLHLWRALVGWLGGLMVWITAFAILAPLNLGGFEVRYAADRADLGRNFPQIARGADPTERLMRFAVRLTPIYAGLTGLLWVALLIAGERPLTAFVHAMSTMATSGISPVGGAPNAASGIAGEVLIMLFLVFALSRSTFSRSLTGDEGGRAWRDPELGMAAVLIGGVTLILFLRHFVAGTAADGGGVGASMAALWGILFTVVSFLTTTGFESREWLDVVAWSGLETPGLVLVGLAIIGGGVATTAGGVKLLRIYALFRHGEREAERLIHPSSVGGAGRDARQIRRQGAQIAWVSFMLFALSIVLLMGLLTLTGVQFETALVLAISALSTTGPLAEVAAENPFSFAGVPDTAKVILAVAMIVGRLEALALIALLNPELWRG